MATADDIAKIADAVAGKLLDDRSLALQDRVRRAVQAELGDENVGELSDRIVAKVIAQLPAPTVVDGGTCAPDIDYDVLAAKTADLLAARLAQ